jgi:hypothetical protein
MHVTRAELAMDYKLSIPTIDRYLKDMRSIKRYAGAILRPTRKCTRIDEDAFREYLQDKERRTKSW